MPGSGERIWYKDQKNFLTDGNVVKFIPDASMARAEQLNALMRFALYFSVLLMVVRRSLTPALLFLSVGVLTWGMNEAHEASETQRERMLEQQDIALDQRTGRLCTKPTLHNPFMNVLSTDVVTRPKRPSACNVMRSDVQTNVEALFAHNLYRDTDDPLARNTSSRQFYTMPVTDIPGDQAAFANWLYGSGPTCKEGNGGRCAALMSRPYMR